MSGLVSGLSNVTHGIMSVLGFGSTSPKAPTPAPAAPTMSNSQAALNKAADEQRKKMAMYGRSSTIMNGGSGLSNLGSVSSASMLGS